MAARNTKNRFFSFEQDEQFIAYCREGLPRDEIAERMGCDVRRLNQVYARLKRAGFKGELPRQRMAQNYRPPMTLAAKAEKIRRLAEAGKPHRAIAAEMGLSRRAVLQFLNEHRLIPEERQKNRGVRRRQEYQLPINQARVRRSAVNEADVKYARQAWREFEKATA